MRKPAKRRTRKYVGIAVAIVVVIAAVLAWLFFFRGGTSSGLTYKAGTAETKTITSSISGTGNVSLSDVSSVSPSVSGTVTGLSAKVGDKVTAGQVLFTIENDQLDIDVANARNSYNSAVLNVEKARLSVLQAEKSLADLQQKYTDQSTTTTTEATTTTTGPGGGSGSTTSSTITKLDIQIQQANVTSAQLQYTSAQTSVKSAKLSLDQAEEKADSRSVTAPISGVITSLNVQNGDSVGSSSSSSSSSNAASGASTGAATGAASSSSSSSSSAALVITNGAAFNIPVTISESDISSVKVGQKAILTFDALPDLTLTGKVTYVDDSGTNSSGVVSYTATITPDTTNDSILGGMSVSAAIITQTATDVIAVPNAAVKTNTSGSYVLLYKGASVTPVQQTVTVGLSDDSYTEIKSGLSVGTKVVIQTINPKSTATTVRSGSGSNSILGGSGTGSRTGAGSGQFPGAGF